MTDSQSALELIVISAHSSADRASVFGTGGRGFESLWAHLSKLASSLDASFALGIHHEGKNTCLKIPKNVFCREFNHQEI